MTLDEIISNAAQAKRAYDEAQKPLNFLINELRAFLLEIGKDAIENRFIVSHISHISIMPPNEGANYFTIHCWVLGDKEYIYERHVPGQYSKSVKVQGERIKLEKDIYFPKITTADIDNRDCWTKLREEFYKKFYDAWNNQK